ncbi:MAG: tRNA (adenosine(37)-N6)-dimethylallyltransferase MiaA [Elusimicrobia bacterium]|nr:tRNA (adenosine(37)-N6)-dimethylallyltransferase MiaA [Elusimicrobiota bacterium]
MTVIAIVGPTASGKTGVAAALSKRVDGEIISADSRQVYKYLDIGTNKSGFWDNEKKMRLFKDVPQHLTDIIEPDETFSAGDFARVAFEKIKYLQQNKKVPIIAGGTGLYLKALMDGLAPMPEKNEEIRKALREKLEKKGIEYLYDELKKIDPESAEKNKDNPHRLIRAIEVFKATGVPISELQKKTSPSKEKFIQFGLNYQREMLYKRINERSIRMLNSGMIEETEKVLRMGYSKSSEAFKSIGYNSVLKYLDKKISKDNLIETLQRDTRHYAKRQMTWFRKDKRINWINLNENQSSDENIADLIFKTTANLV